MHCEFGEVDSPDPGGEQTPTLPTSAAPPTPQEAEPPNQLSTGVNSSEAPRKNIPCLQYGQFSFFFLLIVTTCSMPFVKLAVYIKQSKWCQPSNKSEVKDAIMKLLPLEPNGEMIASIKKSLQI